MPLEPSSSVLYREETDSILFAVFALAAVQWFPRLDEEMPPSQACPNNILLSPRYRHGSNHTPTEAASKALVPLASPTAGLASYGERQLYICPPQYSLCLLPEAVADTSWMNYTPLSKSPLNGDFNEQKTFKRNQTSSIQLSMLSSSDKQFQSVSRPIYGRSGTYASMGSFRPNHPVPMSSEQF